MMTWIVGTRWDASVMTTTEQYTQQHATFAEKKCLGELNDDYLPSDPERLEVCYATQHVESAAEVANIVKRLRNERMGSKEYEDWVKCGSIYHMGGKRFHFEDGTEAST